MAGIKQKSYRVIAEAGVHLRVKPDESLRTDIVIPFGTQFTSPDPGDKDYVEFNDEKQQLVGYIPNTVYAIEEIYLATKEK